ncbi:Cytochrome D1 heme domain protein (plasmid) [Caballeronia sp. SBC1]|uniref:cytochrome D1 domain-containing protein n=1 Tax=unclassified Caballeronia TaxID=2646786 RepID=UPI0013E197C9|nr:MULTISPECIES: cytochrome D1 domain-containing protein [unclassified Caballeronia]QIE28087.1 Cytochrome D1 heme domain protein [Caballeronia sp. SBC2]QIN66151.1 Cytochrome D1 heme domain protein [Caballeronia sp. SBC1]
MHLKKATACLALASVGMLGASLAPAAGPTAYVTSETAGVGVIDLDQMTLAKTFSFGDDGPRGLSLTADGRRLLLANKKPGDLSEVDTATGKVLRRVKIGQNPEFVRVYGGYAYVTYEPGENGGPATGVPGSSGASGGDKGGPSGAGKDDDNANEPPAEIAIVDLKTLRVVRSVKSGHETEGVEFSGDGKELLVTNEGDDTVSVYHVGTGAPLRTLKLDHGSRPRGIKRSPDGTQYVVTLENANKFVVLDARNFKVLKTIDTQLGPYGVAFDPAGKRLMVAAARGKMLQVFDAKTFDHMTDVPVGLRCWHFSFTPDGSKIMLACGRSNAVYVFDATSYQPIKQIEGLPLAWGIVTYPRSAGTIE